MNGNCYDIGVFQAFLDGELAHAESVRVSGHIADCDYCAAMLAAAEEESSIVFPALEREFNSLVPTQRLWTKINDSIAVEASQAPIWKKAWSYLSVRITVPTLAMAASMVVILGVFTAVWVKKPVESLNQPTMQARTNEVNRSSTPDKIAVGLKQQDPAKTSIVEDPDTSSPVEPSRNIVRATYSAPRAVADRSGAKIPNASYQLEYTYVKTIASLSGSVDNEKDSVLRPSERVAFERDMAVVDDAIRKMKTVVRKNPKNETAKQVLYASYQNKIDLLNSVSQKQELMASFNYQRP